jgi:uncharacterized protein (DUF305 family)
VAVLAAGCTTSSAHQHIPDDQTDVWFLQHMAGHLLQTTAIVQLAGDRITRPELARLADRINRQSQAHLDQLQGWLADRGLAPTTPSRTPTAARRSLTLPGCRGSTGPASTWPSWR